MLAMPMRRFYAVNIASALVWAASHILSGVLFGATFRVLGAAAKPAAILLAVLFVAGWAVWSLVRWTLRRAVPLADAGITRLRRWAEGRDTRLGRAIVSLLDPERSEARLLALMLALLVGAAWAFLGILEDVVNGDPLVLADNAIYHALQEIRSPAADAIMIAITELGDPKVVVAVTGCRVPMARLEARVAYGRVLADRRLRSVGPQHGDQGHPSQGEAQRAALFWLERVFLPERP